MEASSATKGFFQPLPVLKNQYTDDASVRRVLRLFVPGSILATAEPEIVQLCDDALEPQIFDWITDAEKNQPYVSGGGKNAFGQPVSSKLVVSDGWQRLQNLGFQKGFSAYGYEPGLAQYGRVISYMRTLLWEGSCANTSCPVAMQDGATRLLQLQLAKPQLSPVERKVYQNAVDHLTSRDPVIAWTSGQWMTERTGGSDVSQSETVATYSPVTPERSHCSPQEGIPLGSWSISGFKWFSSATDSNMTILLAKTPKGLSAFYAPMRRYNPSLVTSPTGNIGGMELNGVAISRLKNKMGTKSLPTAELELNDMRGWLIGEEGRGIQEISTILAITRMRTATGGLGHLSRGLAIARAFTTVREVGAGRGIRVKLVNTPLHMRTLSDMTMEYHGMMLLNFYATYIMSLEEYPQSTMGPPSDVVASITPPKELFAPLLRVLTAVVKAYCTKKCVLLIYECMESLGGVGYLENTETEYLNVARLFRDACVLSIWEGTTDVLSTEFIRALKRPVTGDESIRALDLLIGAATNRDSSKILERWDEVKHEIQSQSQAELLSHARGILLRVAEILIGALYLVDVRYDPNPQTKEMSRRFLVKKGLSTGATDSGSRLDSEAGLRMDQDIVFGSSGWASRKTGSRL